MLEKLRAIAMEKFASTDEVDAFMEGFEKQAFLGMTEVNSKLVSTDFTRSLGSGAAKVGLGLGAALLGAAIVTGISRGAGAVSSYTLRNKFDLALAQVMSSNKIVKGANPSKAREYGETLFKFAPHVASDPNLLNSILANAVLGEGIDAMTIKTLVELEGRVKENSQVTPFAGIRV
jgi:hypothetical protein